VGLDENVFDDGGEAILLRRKRAKARSYVFWPWHAGMRVERGQHMSASITGDAQPILDVPRA